MAQTTSMADSVKKGWKVTGNTDIWKLLCKASNLDTGEYHSTKMLTLEDGSVVLQCDSLVNQATPNRVPYLVFERNMIVLPCAPTE